MPEPRPRPPWHLPAQLHCGPCPEDGSRQSWDAASDLRRASGLGWIGRHGPRSHSAIADDLLQRKVTGGSYRFGPRPLPGPHIPLIPRPDQPAATCPPLSWRRWLTAPLAHPSSRSGRLSLVHDRLGLAMGWKSRYVRSLVSPPRPRPTRLPARAMATVGSTVHRLSWTHKHAGYRMKCSCGWRDAVLHSSETSAIEVGNNHIAGVRRAALAQQRIQAERAMTPDQRKAAKRATMLGRIAIVVLVGALAGGLILIHDLSPTQSSYNDGYQWGQSNTIGILAKTAPSCSRSEMVSSGDVFDPNFFFNKPQGDSEPRDNFGQWRAGCEAGARNTISSSGP